MFTSLGDLVGTAGDVGVDAFVASIAPVEARAQEGGEPISVDFVNAPTVGQIKEFAEETGRSFVDSLHFLTETPLSAAAQAWLSRSPSR